MPNNNALQLAMEAQESLIKAQADLQRLIKVMTASQPGTNRTVLPIEAETERTSFSLVDLDRGDFRYSKPASLRLPDASVKSVKTWKEVVELSVGWLIKQEKITQDTPLEGRRRIPVVARDRMDLSQNHGDPASYISRKGEWWIDTWGNVNTKARKLVAICESVGVDPAGFQVMLRRNSGAW